MVNTCAAIVTDHAEILHTLAREALDQIIRESGAAEAAEHNRRAVGNVGDGGINGFVDFVFSIHRAGKLIASELMLR